MRGLLLLSLFALAACDTQDVMPPPQAVQVENGLAFSTDHDTYRRGGTARVALHSARRDTLMSGVVDCARLEVWNGSGWAPAREREDRPCIAMAVYLEPGRTLRGAVPLRVPSGTYRATHSLVTVGRPGDPEAVPETVIAVTSAFRVR